MEMRRTGDDPVTGLEVDDLGAGPAIVIAQPPRPARPRGGGPLVSDGEPDSRAVAVTGLDRR